MNWLSRFRVVIVVLMGLLSYLAGNTAFAKPDSNDKLVGLWEGVDTLDGSTMRIAIGDLDGDKQLDFRWHESFFSGCFDINIPQGRGVISGTVHRLGKDQIELAVTSFVCFDDDNNEVELDTFSIEMDYSSKADILLKTTEDGFPGFILYRTSSGGGK